MMTPSFIANLIWPVACLEAGLLSFWPITLGLLLEWPFVRWATKTKWPMGFCITLAVNFASALMGVFAIRLIGLLVTIPHGFLAEILKIDGTFGPSGWILTYLAAAFMMTCVEVAAFRRYFCRHFFEKRELPIPSLERVWVGMGMANLLSIAVAFCFIPYPA